ncbi:MAG: hypothetical protein CYG60_14745 [Actinobacteria bacterium]|nr:MAG: hypothetical protein CYG60_14745 [Actinomycetota bacterium]
MSADGIARRLARLEAANPPPCDECGHGPGVPIPGFVVEVADEPDAGTEFCPTCGERLVCVVTWGDGPEGEGLT